MRPPFWLKLAAREMRASTRRLAVYMGAITLGVAALVAINSFRAQVVESVDSESKALLGADLRISGNRAFPDSITDILDSAAVAGVPVSRVTTTLSVALTRAGAVRLAQVRAVAGGYPFYGEMVTAPAGMWSRLDEPGTALVEQTLIEQLGVSIGDSIRLGNAWFEIRGALTSLPPELSFRNAVGPRIYIGEAGLSETGLLRFGSLARYEAYVQIRDDEELQRFVDRNHDVFRRAGVGFETAAEQAENLAQALESLGRFLGLVGLSALLLGGLGVASAVNVFVKEKRRTVAVLRCLGATQRTAFGAYLLQATLIGTTGAVVGAVLGVVIQAVLPSLIGDALPIDVPFAVQWDVVTIGVAIGALVSGTFALLPLLAVRGISPLRALRHDVDDTPSRFDPWRIAAFALIIASVAAVSIWQARLWQAGLAYAGALMAGMGILWVCARLLITLTRRAARGSARLARGDRSGGHITMKQKLAQHYLDDSCKNCHQRMDYVGLAMEHMDPIGKYRADDQGLPIETSFEYGNLKFASIADLGTSLAADPLATQCIVNNFWRQSMGHLETDGEQAALEAIHTKFAESGFRVQDMLVEMAVSPAFQLVAEPK